MHIHVASCFPARRTLLFRPTSLHLVKSSPSVSRDRPQQKIVLSPRPTRPLYPPLFTSTSAVSEAGLSEGWFNPVSSSIDALMPLSVKSTLRSVAWLSPADRVAGGSHVSSLLQQMNPRRAAHRKGKVGRPKTQKQDKQRVVSDGKSIPSSASTARGRSSTGPLDLQLIPATSAISDARDGESAELASTTSGLPASDPGVSASDSVASVWLVQSEESAAKACAALLRGCYHLTVCLRGAYLDQDCGVASTLYVASSNSSDVYVFDLLSDTGSNTVYEALKCVLRSHAIPKVVTDHTTLLWLFYLGVEVGSLLSLHAITQVGVPLEVLCVADVERQSTAKAAAADEAPAEGKAAAAAAEDKTQNDENVKRRQACQWWVPPSTTIDHGLDIPKLAEAWGLVFSPSVSDAYTAYCGLKESSWCRRPLAPPAIAFAVVVGALADISRQMFIAIRSSYLVFLTKMSRQLLAAHRQSLTERDVVTRSLRSATEQHTPVVTDTLVSVPSLAQTVFTSLFASLLPEEVSNAIRLACTSPDTQLIEVVLQVGYAVKLRYFDEHSFSSPALHSTDVFVTHEMFDFVSQRYKEHAATFDTSWLCCPQNSQGYIPFAKMDIVSLGGSRVMRLSLCRYSKGLANALRLPMLNDRVLIVGKNFAGKKSFLLDYATSFAASQAQEKQAKENTSVETYVCDDLIKSRKMYVDELRENYLYVARNVRSSAEVRTVMSAKRQGFSIAAVVSTPNLFTALLEPILRPFFGLTVDEESLQRERSGKSLPLLFNPADVVFSTVVEVECPGSYRVHRDLRKSLLSMLLARSSRRYFPCDSVTTFLQEQHARYRKSSFEPNSRLSLGSIRIVNSSP